MNIFLYQGEGETEEGRAFRRIMEEVSKNLSNCTILDDIKKESPKMTGENILIELRNSMLSSSPIHLIKTVRTSKNLVSLFKESIRKYNLTEETVGVSTFNLSYMLIPGCDFLRIELYEKGDKFLLSDNGVRSISRCILSALENFQ